jgi:hypothetical protein
MGSMPFKRRRVKTGGRKKGTPNKKTLAKQEFEKVARSEIQATLADPGKLGPLEVMLLAMHLKMYRGDVFGAVEFAEKAAPFTSPRLNATDVKVQHSYSRKSDAEVAAEIEALQQKIAAAQQQQLKQIEGTILPQTEHNQDDISNAE